MPADEEKRVYRSVSQVKEYDPERGGCPHRYYLHRIEKVWEKPAAWLPQGLGVHEAAEFWEKSDRTATLEQTKEAFIDSYAKHTNRLCETTPNLRFWFWSGPYDGERDIERRFGIGLEQIVKYVEYYTKKPKEVPFTKPDGRPYIEHPFNMKLGDVWVRGYTDQVVWDTELGEWVARDIKTGKSPGDEFQLATYGIAFAEEFDISLGYGDYWMARTGKPTISYDLSEWTKERLTDEFGQLDDNVRAERFDPAPEPDKCRFCSVNRDCEYRAADSF